MSRPVTLRILIALHLVWTFLLTPLALEPRPFSTINPIGWVSLAMIFTTVGLDIAAFLLLARRPRTAASIAAIGSVLFIPPFIGDQLGLFSTLAPPTQITVVEVAALVTQLAILVVAVRLRREISPA
jgi:hypothetical protein